MSNFIMPLNMTVKELMILSGKKETTCRKNLKIIKKRNKITKRHQLVTPDMVCKFLKISYEEAYKRLKDFYDRGDHKNNR
jgi:hypothetical protein